MDFEGHGIHEIQRSFRIEHFAENLFAFITKHNLAPANIFGYSMGGFVALYAAMNQPDLINRIFTFATKLDWNPESAVSEAKMLNAEMIEQKFPDYAESLKQRHSADWKKVLQYTSEMMLHLGNRHPLLTKPALSLSNVSFNELNHHVRFSVGDKDKMVSIEETTTWYRKLKHAELQVFPHTQHPIERVDINMLATAIKNFFYSR